MYTTDGSITYKHIKLETYFFLWLHHANHFWVFSFPTKDRTQALTKKALRAKQWNARELPKL